MKLVFGFLRWQWHSILTLSGITPFYQDLSPQRPDLLREWLVNTEVAWHQGIRPSRWPGSHRVRRNELDQKNGKQNWRRAMLASSFCQSISADQPYRPEFPTPPWFSNMSTRAIYRRSRRKLVLAFDVGTTYSGISYRWESLKVFVFQ